MAATPEERDVKAGRLSAAEYEANFSDLHPPLTHHEGNQNLLERFWHASTLVELQSILDQCPRRTYVVRPGDHFIGLVYAATGRRDVLVLDLVERMNPQVTDFDLIEVGWPLILPDFTSSASETSEVAGTPSG